MFPELKTLRGFLLLLSGAVLFGIGANAVAQDCEKLLVPDFALPGTDATTDLAYLAAITPENFSAHRANAFPMLSRSGVLLPIARDLLQHAKNYEEFSSRRAQKYTELAFDYPMADLAAYYRRLLPTERLNRYETCTGASGALVQVVKADRDFVQVLLSWHAPAGGPAQVALGKLDISGATLLGAAPATLQAQPVSVMLARNLDADLRLSAGAGTEPVSLWVPRFIASPGAEPAEANCAAAGKVVRLLFRQTLRREPKSAELAAQTALLNNGDNSVRQLGERIVLSDEFQKKFASGKQLEDVLEALYERVLARDSDTKGLASNKARFRDAAFATVAITFFENAEYERRFGEWTVPGAPPSVRYCPAPN